MPRCIALAALALGSLASRPAVPPIAERIAPNDNRHTAGSLHNGVLTVALEARNGAWQPEGENGRALDVAAFAEVGKPLATPGPFIRVPEGTEIRATIRNRLDKPLIVYGFGRSRGMSDSVIVPVNAAVWRPVAKDGYPLQESQEVPRPAVVVFDPGEIYDFEVTPATTGELTLKFGLVPPPPPPPGTPPPAPAQTAPPPGSPPAPAPPPPTVSVVVHVR